jgi:hypothetical protein
MDSHRPEDIYLLGRSEAETTRYVNHPPTAVRGQLRANSTLQATNPQKHDDYAQKRIP